MILACRVNFSLFICLICWFFFVMKHYFSLYRIKYSCILNADAIFAIANTNELINVSLFTHNSTAVRLPVVIYLAYSGNRIVIHQTVYDAFP